MRATDGSAGPRHRELSGRRATTRHAVTDDNCAGRYDEHRYGRRSRGGAPRGPSPTQEVRAFHGRAEGGDRLPVRMPSSGNAQPTTSVKVRRPERGGQGAPASGAWNETSRADAGGRQRASRLALAKSEKKDEDEAVLALVDRALSVRVLVAA